MIDFGPVAVPMMVVHLNENGGLNPGWLSCPDCGSNMLQMDFAQITDDSTILRIGGWCRRCIMDFAWAFESVDGKTKVTSTYRLNPSDKTDEHIPVWA